MQDDHATHSEATANDGRFEICAREHVMSNFSSNWPEYLNVQAVCTVQSSRDFSIRIFHVISSSMIFIWKYQTSLCYTAVQFSIPVIAPQAVIVDKARIFQRTLHDVDGTVIE